MRTWRVCREWLAIIELLKRVEGNKCTHGRNIAQGDDGSNDLIVSDIIRTGELEVWFLAEHLV